MGDVEFIRSCTPVTVVFIQVQGPLGNFSIQNEAYNSSIIIAKSRKDQKINRRHVIAQKIKIFEHKYFLRECQVKYIIV